MSTATDPTLRQLRRALRRSAPVPDDAPLELTSLEGRHDLRDTPARSLAIEREGEVMIDATLADDALLAGEAAPGEDGDVHLT